MEALPYPALATDAPQEVPVSPPQTGEMRLAPSETDRIPHLIHSLTTLSRLHGHGVSPLLLMSGAADLAASPAACLRAAQRAGLEGRIIPIDDVSFISPLALPCIPLLKHNRSCVLTKLGEHEAEIILPEDGENPRTIPLDQLQADFAGHVLFARPAPKLERRTESEHFFHEKRWVWGVLSHYLPIYKHVIVASVIINIIGTEDVRLATSGTLPVPADPLGILSGLLNGLTYSATTLNGLYGTFTLNANGSYTYTLNNNLGAVQGLTTGETLLDVLPYKVTNILGAALNGSYAVTIHGTNDAPTMSLAAAAFARTDLTLTGVLPPPHDPDAHDTASYQPLTAQAGLYGTLTLNADGTYTYVLNSTLDTVRELGAGESLQDVFSCTVIDSHGATGAGVFTITINGSNDAPTAADATASVTAAVSGDQVLATGILPHPADPNIHDVLSFVPLAAEAGSYGTLTLAADGSWTYTLNNAADAVRQLGAGATLTDTITYQVADNHGATGNATLSVTIYGVNDLPAVAAATASVTEDTAAAASGILPAPTDPDSGDSVSFVPIAGGAGLFGTLNLDADGHYTYTLNNSLAAVQGLGEGQTLTDTFIYTVTDAHGGTGSNTLTVTINGVNDSPSVAAATADVTEDVQTLVTGTLPAPHDQDNYGVPNDILSFTPQIAEPGAYGSLTLNADGTYTYILNNALPAVQNLNAGNTLTDTFTYTVTDNHGGTGSNTLTVTIHGLDEPSGGGTYAAPQTASLSVTAETGEAVPAGTGATSSLPDYLQPEGDSLASVLNHYASSGSGQGHETAATDGTPPEDGAAPDASPLPSSEDGGAPTVSAPTETAVHDAQPQQYSEPYTPPMESSTETLQQNVSQELARNGGI